jgi:hypothetical protein
MSQTPKLAVQRSPTLQASTATEVAFPTPGQGAIGIPETLGRRHTNRLRALMLSDEDNNRQIARAALTTPLWPSWPGVGPHAMPAASRPCGTPGSAD